MILRQRICLLLLAPLLAWNASASADSVVLNPTKTNTLIQVASASDQQLSNGLGDVFVGRTNQDGPDAPTISIRRGLVAFDPAAAVPPGATITAVTMTADDVKGMNGNQTISLNRMLTDWGQGTSFFNGGIGGPATDGDVTWYYTFYNSANPSASPAWAAPGGQPGVDYSASVSASSLILAGSVNQTFTWSSSNSPALVSDVQQWLDSPGTSFGWIMFGNESAGMTAHRFGGQYATSPESPMQLTIQYTAPWTWSGSGGNSAWTTSGNWTNGGGFPPSGAAIVLGDSHSTSGTVDLVSSAPSISHLTFDAAKIMTITDSAIGGGTLTLDNGISPVAVVVSGSGHAIDDNVRVALNSDAWITTSSTSDLLRVAGNLQDGSAAHGLVKQGPGVLVLSGSDTYTGGTTISDGTLIAASVAAIEDGTSVTVGSNALMFDSSDASTPAEALQGEATAVPEPRTWALLAAGFLAMTLASVRKMARTVA